MTSDQLLANERQRTHNQNVERLSELLTRSSRPLGVAEVLSGVAIADRIQELRESKPERVVNFPADLGDRIWNAAHPVEVARWEDEGGAVR